MTHTIVLSNSLFQESQTGGNISPWVWLLIILFIILIVAWRLISNRGRQDFPLDEHHEHAEAARLAEVDVSPKSINQRIDEERASDMESSGTTVQVPTEVPADATQSPDNLIIIEGIGPKIASVFEANGITTFAQLSSTPVSELQQILQKEGLRLADPTTWPEQARLAAAGDWDGLNALQSRLKAGRQE